MAVEYPNPTWGAPAEAPWSPGLMAVKYPNPTWGAPAEAPWSPRG